MSIIVKSQFKDYIVHNIEEIFHQEKKRGYFDKRTFLAAFRAMKIELKRNLIGRSFKKKREKYLLAVSALIFQRLEIKGVLSLTAIIVQAVITQVSNFITS